MSVSYKYIVQYTELSRDKEVGFDSKREAEVFMDNFIAKSEIEDESYIKGVYYGIKLTHKEEVKTKIGPPSK